MQQKKEFYFKINIVDSFLSLRLFKNQVNEKILIYKSFLIYSKSFLIYSKLVSIDYFFKMLNCSVHFLLNNMNVFENIFYIYKNYFAK